MASEDNAGKNESPAAATPATDRLRSLLLPLARSYVRAPAAKAPDGTTQPATGEAAAIDDNEALRLAGRKLLAERGVVVTQKYPVLPEGTTLKLQSDTDGYFGDLSVTHVLSAVKMVQSIFAAPPATPPEQTSAPDVKAEAGTPQVARAYVITQTPMDVRLVREVVRESKQVPSPAGATEAESSPAAPAQVKMLSLKTSGTGKTAAPAPAATSRTCGSWSISCETRDRLTACLKQAICDFLFCVEGQICVNGKLNLVNGRLQLKENWLLECLSPVACKLIHCIPDAICPPVSSAPTLPETHLVCDFAVEEPGQ
jgi:hypothetical protein